MKKDQIASWTARVTSREGRVSRNDGVKIPAGHPIDVTSREGRVSRNLIAAAIDKR